MKFNRLTSALSAAAGSLRSSTLVSYPATRSSAMVAPGTTWSRPAPTSSRPPTGVWDGRIDPRSPQPF